MKVMTVLGTRPEIIRLSRVIPILDEHADHVLVHTGQNFTETLSDVFFEELDVREPDVALGIRADSFGEQIGRIISAAEELFTSHRPDRLLLLGDTNSSLVSIVAKRMGLPVYHMEAGNRCFDDRVPEEVNRRIIDHSSTVLMPYTERSKANLTAEGFPPDRVYVTGNPIFQVMQHHAEAIDASDVLRRLSLDDDQYFLVTAHRAENVDDPRRLASLVDALVELAERMPVVMSVHPRTRSQAGRHGIALDHPNIHFLEPLGFIDFLRLEKSAHCVLTDSGTVQEEACILGTPSVTIRDVTERPETIDAGSNVLAGMDTARIVTAVDLVTNQSREWRPPPEYLEPRVAETVSRIVLGYRLPGRDEQAWASRA